MVGIRPVDEGNFVVLAIGVVVALLGAAELVAGREHRGAARQKQGGEQREEIAPAALADGGVAALALRAVVPGVILAEAVAIALAIRFIVLLGIAHDIGEAEAVMARKIVHAGRRWSEARLENIGGTGKARREQAGRSRHRPSRSGARHLGICRSIRGRAPGILRGDNRRGPRPEGSAMTTGVSRSTGSCAIAARRGASGENPASERPSTVARSKRKPSMPAVSTNGASHRSRAAGRAPGRRRAVLPQAVSLTSRPGSSAKWR